jgi:NAD(P) transhydrogenase subunit alpha
MSIEIALLTIFILSIFVGFEVVSKVSTILHTPLMSGDFGRRNHCHWSC